MKKRWLVILGGVAAALVLVCLGAVGGGALAYYFLDASPARASFIKTSIQPVEESAGLLVAVVEADSPAAKAGVKRGDIILQADDTEINTVGDLQTALKEKKAGDELQIRLQHGDETRNLTVSLSEVDGKAYLGILPCVGGMPGDGMMFFNKPFMQTVEGNLVASVKPDSPADEAGLQAGDVITAVDGAELTVDEDLSEIIHTHKPGDVVTLTVLRPGKTDNLEIKVTLGENPEKSGESFLGITYRRSFGIPGGEQPPFEFRLLPPPGEQPRFGEGERPFRIPIPELPEGIEQAIIVIAVEDGSPAAEAGLKAGDAITALDGEAVSDPRAFAQAIAGHKVGEAVTLTVYHEGDAEPVEMKVTLGENPDKPGTAYLGIHMGSFMRHESKLPLPDFLIPHQPIPRGSEL